MRQKGIFISLEGIDGSGKTTLKEYLLSHLKDYEVLGIREPGGTLISEKIRDMLLDIKNESISLRTEALLYAAARSQVVEEVIKPALKAGKIVIADRYLDSTIAYQGYARGLPLDFLEQLNNLCTGDVKPHLTLVLDLDPREGQSRREKGIPDRLEKEGLAFQSRVRNGYLKIAQQEPQRVKIINAGQEPQKVGQEALLYINSIIR